MRSGGFYHRRLCRQADVIVGTKIIQFPTIDAAADGPQPFIDSQAAQQLCGVEFDQRLVDPIECRTCLNVG